MSYTPELHFLRNVLERCRLQSLLIHPDEPLCDEADLGLRRLLGHTQAASILFSDFASDVRHCTVYRMRNEFNCCYIYFLLTDTTTPTVLWIGPYLTEEPSQQRILEIAERVGLPARSAHVLEKYYTALPLLAENSHIFVLLDTFCEHLWGGNNAFTLEEIERDASSLSTLPADGLQGSPETGEWTMQMMEKRYAYENELIEAVSKGQIHQAERLFSGITSSLPFERRLSDSLREMKNYCIIMNTLLRKAAENGGVHPMHLDSMSSTFARKIESVGGIDEVPPLMNEMFRFYCRLVREHSIRKYSPPVQKAIIAIDSDLSANLTLRSLAEQQSISAGYLSSLFRQETGQTLTDHIRDKRIRLAKRLLRTTQLQIQTIAQHCGIYDVQYFSKLFKSCTGKTPKEYRQSASK